MNLWNEAHRKAVREGTTVSELIRTRRQLVGGAALNLQGIGNRPTAAIYAGFATRVRGLGPVQWKQKRSRK